MKSVSTHIPIIFDLMLTIILGGGGGGGGRGGGGVGMCGHYRYTFQLCHLRNESYFSAFHCGMKCRENYI